MHEIVNQPVYFAIYFIAVIAAVFHFANGLWAFLVSWGITVGPRAQRVSSNICIGIFVIVSVLFLLSLFAFRSAEFAPAAAAAAGVSPVMFG